MYFVDVKRSNKDILISKLTGNIYLKISHTRAMNLQTLELQAISLYAEVEVIANLNDLLIDKNGDVQKILEKFFNIKNDIG